MKNSSRYVLKKGDRFWGTGSFGTERPSHKSNAQEELTLIGKISAAGERTVYTMRGFRNVTAGSPAEQVPQLVRRIKEVESRYPRRHRKEGDTLYFPFVRDSANRWQVRTYDADADMRAVMKKLVHEKRTHAVLSAIVESVERKYSATVAHGIESYYVQDVRPGILNGCEDRDRFPSRSVSTGSGMPSYAES